MIQGCLIIKIWTITNNTWHNLPPGIITFTRRDEATEHSLGFQPQDRDAMMFSFPPWRGGADAVRDLGSECRPRTEVRICLSQFPKLTKKL